MAFNGIFKRENAESNHLHVKHPNGILGKKKCKMDQNGRNRNHSIEFPSQFPTQFDLFILRTWRS